MADEVLFEDGLSVLRPRSHSDTKTTGVSLACENGPAGERECSQRTMGQHPQSHATFVPKAAAARKPSRGDDDGGEEANKSTSII